MGAAAGDPATAAEAAAFLQAHRALIERQLDTFDEDRRLGEHAASLKRALDWIKLIAQAGIALVVTGVVVVLASMTWSAANDRALVVNRFTVPPDLSDRQIRGEDFSALVADKLATLQTKGQSFRNEASFQNGWGKDIKIAVPGAGVSLGDLDRTLRDLLGHETKVEGTLYHSDNMLKLSMRAGDGGAIETTGDADHLDALAQKAAEALLERIEPYRYSKYLEFSGRMEEALAVARRVAASEDPPVEKAWAWAQISNLLVFTDLEGASQAGLRAAKLDPENALAFLNASNAEALLGRDQASVELLAKSILLAKKGGGLSPIGKTTSLFNQTGTSLQEGDYGRAVEVASDRTTALYANISDYRAAQLAQAYALWHDLTAARQVDGQLPEGEYVSHLFTNGNYFSPGYAKAVTAEDWPTAVAAAQLQLDALAKAPEGPVLAKAARERFVQPDMAIALARSGRLAEAQAITATLPRDGYLALRAIGLVAGMGGDMAAANRAYGEAVRRNPSLPFADLEWGGLLLSRGDAAGAIAHFARAAQLAPRFADPVKAWGDALMAQRRPREAIEKYAAAATLAPRWGGLKLAWGEALAASGEPDKARAQLQAAAGLDLTEAERARLARALGPARP